MVVGTQDAYWTIQEANNSSPHFFSEQRGTICLENNIK